MADPHSQHSSVMTIVCSLPHQPIWRAVLMEPRESPHKGAKVSPTEWASFSWEDQQDLTGLGG